MTWKSGSRCGSPSLWTLPRDGSDGKLWALQLSARMNEVIAKVQTARDKIDDLTTQLGTSDREELKRLRSNAFLQALVNARTLKNRIIAKLQFRKLELLHLDKSSRLTTNGTYYF